MLPVALLSQICIVFQIFLARRVTHADRLSPLQAMVSDSMSMEAGVFSEEANMLSYRELSRPGIVALDCLRFKVADLP